MGLNGFSGVLFDLDGVILDSMQHHADLWQELMEAMGLQIRRGFILENEGALGAEVLQSFMAEQGITADLAQAQANMAGLLDTQAARYIKERAHLVKPFPGAEELLTALNHGNTPAALVTSSRREVVAGCLPESLYRRFDAVVTAGDVARHKPHPDPYQAGARALGLEPAQCLAVENAPAGIASARAAGAQCWAVCTTLPAEKLAQAHEVFPHLEAVGRRLGVLR